VSCSELSLAAGVPLAGTATQTHRFLVVEHPGPWGRDAVPDTELPPDVADALLAFEGRVMLARRPGRPDAAVTAFVAEVTEEGGALRRIELERLEDVASLDEKDGTAVDGPLLLVCAHRRRDVCCARLGVPVFNALRPHVPRDLLWRSSHHGGHRFAANVLALPAGIQLGRVMPGEAQEVAAALAEGRIPLAHFRGRTLHAPEVQTADAAVRVRDRLDRLSDVRLVEHDRGRVVLATPTGVVEVRVDGAPGPILPSSCGAEPEPTVVLVATPVG